MDNFTQKKLEEFDERYMKWADGHWGTHKDDLKFFLKESMEQARDEERERIKKKVQSIQVYEKNTVQNYTTGYANGFRSCKDKILTSLNNQDK